MLAWLDNLTRRRRPRPARRRRRRLRRNYDAAKTDRLIYNWGKTAVTINAALKGDLEILISRSREQRRNNDWVRAFVRQVTRNVVGPVGITSVPGAVTNTGNPDRPANAAISAAWKDWGKSCDVTGALDWRAFQRLWIATVAADGAALLRKHNIGPYGLQLQLIDNLMLDIKLNGQNNGNDIIMGVEVDSLMRPVAYYLTEGTTAGTGISRQGHQRIPADEIIYSYIVEEIGQIRGVPWAATTLPRLNMLDGYEDAALVAARAGAAKMGFYLSEGDEEYIGDDEDEDGELYEEIEAGIARKLPRGVRWESYDPTYPHEQYETFTKSQLRAIASALGVSYNGLANDLEGVNYSSMRAGKLDEWDIWKEIQDWMIGQLVDPVYQLWLDRALTLGKIKLGAGSLPVSKIWKFSAVEHFARRWPWVDPKNEIAADAQAVDMRVTSRSRIIRERYGRDPVDVFAEIADEERILQEAGLLAGEPEAEDDGIPEDEDDGNDGATVGDDGAGNSGDGNN